MIRQAVLLACCLLQGACSAHPDPTFVVAARDLLEAVGPEYRAYVDADPALTVEQRRRRHRTIDRFERAVAIRELR